MDNILEKVNQTIHDFRLIARGDRVLVALSGGPDSIALLHVLTAIKAQYGITLAAGHLDHGLRKQSASDREFCRRVCKGMGIKFYSKRVNIAALAQNSGLSIEEAGRNARYSYLDSLARKHGFTKIATGHTLDDNIETVIWNMVRGSGLAGLAGIPPKRGNIIRPLLRIEKNELLRWLKSQKISYVKDVTNLSLGYSRNRIRLKVLPEFIRLNSGAKKNIERMAELAREELEYISGQAVSAYKKALIKADKSKIVLDLGKLSRYDKSLRKKALEKAFDGLTGSSGGLSSQNLSRALDVLDGKSGGKAPLGKGILIEKSQGQVALVAGRQRSEKMTIRVPGKTLLPLNAGCLEASILERCKLERLKQSGNVANLDWKKMNDIKVRFWKNGDRIKPLGMTGHKMLSDIFIDHRIPEFERRSIPLVLSGDSIAWIAGLMISDDFKITAGTKIILNLKLCKR